MDVIKNPKKYSKNKPTNIRLQSDLKKKAIEEAGAADMPLAFLINKILKDYFIKKEE